MYHESLYCFNSDGFSDRLISADRAIVTEVEGAGKVKDKKIFFIYLT